MRRRRVMLSLVMLLVLVVLVVVVGAAWVQWGQPDPVIRVVPLGQLNYAYMMAVDARAGHVYVGIAGGGGSPSRIQVLDAGSGTLQRPLSSSFMPLQFAVAPGTGRVFTISNPMNGQNMGVAMLDARRDTLLHVTAIPRAPFFYGGSMVVRGGDVVVTNGGQANCAGAGGCIYLRPSIVALLDAQSGRLLHVIPVPDEVVVADLDTRVHHIVVAGRTYQSNTPTISVLDAVTGRLVHRTVLRGPTIISWLMTIDAQTGRAFVLGTARVPFPSKQPQSYLYVIDTHTGRLIHTVTMGSIATDIALDTRRRHVFLTVYGPMRYVSKTVSTGVNSSSGISRFMPIGNGHLAMLDARTGALLRTSPLGLAPTALAIDTQRGRVFVTNAGSHDTYDTVNGTPITMSAPVTGAGGLTVLDARTGQVRHTLHLGTQPTAIVLDERTQRAFIGDR